MKNNNNEKLGVLIPGMGAVASTFICGVIACNKGLAKPIGSMSQMGSIRLGKRTEDRSPIIKDLLNYGIEIYKIDTNNIQRYIALTDSFNHIIGLYDTKKKLIYPVIIQLHLK